MPPDKNQNINLIPSDLERKRQVIKQVIAQAPREYTETDVSQGSRPSFWSRILAFKLKTKSAKPPLVESPVIKPTRLPSRPQLKPLLETANKALLVTKEMTVAAGAAKNDVRAGENFGVNLLSAEYASAFITQNQKSFFAYAAGGCVVLVILFYIGLHLYQLQKSGQVERSQQANTELEGAIASFSDLEKEDQILGRKVGVIKELLAAHISTQAFLEKLEAATIPEVTFLALAAAPAGGVTVTARATSYTTLARQLTVLQESAPWIKEVNVASATLVHSKEGKEDGVEFDMVLKVDPNIFKTSEVK